MKTIPLPTLSFWGLDKVICRKHPARCLARSVLSIKSVRVFYLVSQPAWKILSVSETALGLQRDVLPLPYNQSKTKWDPRGGERTVLKKAAEGVWRASADRELNKRGSVSQRSGQGSDPTACTRRTLWAGMRSPKSSMEEQVPPGLNISLCVSPKHHVSRLLSSYCILFHTKRNTSSLRQIFF